MSKKQKLKHAGMSRHAMSLAKQTASNAASGEGEEEPEIDMVALEEEVMGESRDPDAKKSVVMERNLNQMVSVLQLRLAALGQAATDRQQYCVDDLDVHSNRMSRFAPKITEDFEDMGATPKSDDNNKVTKHSSNNLVSNGEVYIDASRLILKTKAPTESGKRMEATMDEAFGTNSFSGMANKGGKVAKTTRTKKSEAQKHENKRQARIRLEKGLQVNMDNFVTRSVLDADIEYRVDASQESGAEQWPITLQWPNRDPRSKAPDNADGVMKPDLLLLYAIEKMSLPSGENLFKWLIKQLPVQQEFVYLFWYTKVKFFQKDAGIHQENHLMKRISLEHIKIVELLSKKASEEHEKDFVYRYLPYILAHALYYAFYFNCPGSRHLYTKPFRKTLLMQVVKVLHGIQLCPVSVKVTWEQIFPEETNTEDEEVAVEEFPTQVAQPTTAQLRETAQLVENTFMQTALPSLPATASSTVLSDSRMGSPSNRLNTGRSCETNLTNDTGATGRAKEGQGRGSRGARKGGLLAGEDGEAMGGADSAGLGMAVTINTEGGQFVGEGIMTMKDTAGSSGGFGGVGGTIGGTGESRPNTGGSRPGTGMTQLPKAELLARISENPLSRSTLLPPPLRPKAGVMFPRQPCKPMDAQSVSPLMQHFMEAPSGNVGRYKQSLTRTVPVSWCLTGGSDTHKRRTIPRELHDDISKRAASHALQSRLTTFKSHRDRVLALKGIDKNMDAVLKSGPTNLAKFSHDLMKQQALRRRGGEKDTKEKIDIFGVSGQVQYAFTVDQLLQEDDIVEFL